MTATNPAGGDGLNGFNGSFTAILPVGVTLAGSAVPPAETSVLADGRTAYFFENVGDIQDGSTLNLDLTVSVTAADFPVGSTVDIDGNFAANTNPRTVPDFDRPPAASPATPPGRRPERHLRTLLCRSRSTRPTSPSASAEDGARRPRSRRHVPTAGDEQRRRQRHLVVVDDFIPAIVEFLGCGGVDNTTDAPTNPNPSVIPASTLEYPGADPLSDTAAPAGPCPAPVLVESVNVVGGIIQSGTATNGTTAPASVVDGVYTHVRWDVGTLTHGQLRLAVRDQLPGRHPAHRECA